MKTGKSQTLPETSQVDIKAGTQRPCSNYDDVTASYARFQRGTVDTDLVHDCVQMHVAWARVKAAVSTALAKFVESDMARRGRQRLGPP